VGIESTVVDVTVEPVRVLRPGMVTLEALAGVLGRGGVVAGGGAVGVGEPLRSPGQMARHYAPRARLLVWRWGDEGELGERLRREGIEAGRAHVIAHQVIPGGGVAGRVCVIPADPEAYARALYAEWHRCDELGAGVIVMEAPPSTPEWMAIADRLARASVRG
jgi:L-threonylcarbamoyladenylate synthase